MAGLNGNHFPSGPPSGNLDRRQDQEDLREAIALILTLLDPNAPIDIQDRARLAFFLRNMLPNTDD